MKAFIVMGVAGCGKSSVGEQLAKRFGFEFIEGDDLHDPASIEKMSGGNSLTDEDRMPWLRRIGERVANSSEPVVISCSALKRSYRDLIRLHADKPVLFLHLSAPQPVIAKRIKQRAGHFMPPALLTSQFQTLEPLDGDEPRAVIDIIQPLERSINDAGKIVEQYFR